jgi:hypothetical protein
MSRGEGRIGKKDEKEMKESGSKKGERLDR